MPPAAALPAFPRLFPRPGRCPNQREEDGGAHPPQPAGNRPGPALRRLSLGGVLKGGAGPRGPAAGSSSGGWGAGTAPRGSLLRARGGEQAPLVVPRGRVGAGQSPPPGPSRRCGGTKGGGAFPSWRPRGGGEPGQG